MRVTVRPLPAWPYGKQSPRSATYRSTYTDTLTELDDELSAIGAREVIIGVVASERDVRIDGQLRADAKVGYPGVELSFELPDGRRVAFHTDRHRGYASSWQDNLRAIVLGLRALRAVSRYGITEGVGEQYAGFAQLPSGGPDPERGRRLVERLGSVGKALRATHPDTRDGDYTDRDFADVQAYREATEGRLTAGATR